MLQFLLHSRLESSGAVTMGNALTKGIPDPHLLSGGAELQMDAVTLLQRNRLENLDWSSGPHILMRTC
jgi:hypothetical protein